MSDIRYLRQMIDDVPVVTAPPEIDITTADQLHAVLLDTAARGHATVVVDLTRTRFCDSHGLHTLLRAHKLAQADGGELRLVTPADGIVPRIFALMCLDRLIPCFASLREALAPTPAARISGAMHADPTTNDMRLSPSEQVTREPDSQVSDGNRHRAGSLRTRGQIEARGSACAGRRAPACRKRSAMTGACVPWSTVRRLVLKERPGLEPRCAEAIRLAVPDNSAASPGRKPAEQGSPEP